MNDAIDIDYAIDYIDIDEAIDCIDLGRCIPAPQETPGSSTINQSFLKSLAAAKA